MAGVRLVVSTPPDTSGATVNTMKSSCCENFSTLSTEWTVPSASRSAGAPNSLPMPAVITCAAET